MILLLTIISLLTGQYETTTQSFATRHECELALHDAIHFDQMHRLGGRLVIEESFCYGG
jgi:hypothetical protein